jgi:hypothetical protein
LLRENRHAKQRAATKNKRRFSRTKNRSHVHTISCRSQPTVTLWGPERFVNRLRCAYRISGRLIDGVTTLTGKDVLRETAGRGKRCKAAHSIKMCEVRPAVWGYGSRLRRKNKWGFGRLTGQSVCKRLKNPQLFHHTRYRYCSFPWPKTVLRTSCWHFAAHHSMRTLVTITTLWSESL